MSHITGAARLFAILGDPVRVVRSPAAWNAAFARLGMDAAFVPIQVTAADLPTVWEGLTRIGNLDGLVLTMPHKSALLDRLDLLAPQARLTGVVNTIRRRPDGRWEGDMFDGLGFVDGLRVNGVAPEGRSIWQAGCGGAGRAIAFALAAAGIANIELHDAQAGRAAALAAELARAFPALRAAAGAAQPGAQDIIINATPLGLKPDDPLPFAITAVQARQVVADVIPNPEFTALLQAAQRIGCTVSTGRHMFEGQARLAAAFLGVQGW